MSIQIPTTKELKDTIIQQIEIKLGGTVSLLPRKFINILATVLAGVLIILYKYGGYIFLQQFVSFASTEPVTINGKKVIPLVEWGRLVGADERQEATRFEGDIDITVINQVGTLPLNTQLISTVNGYTYITLAEIPLTAATVTAPIRAVSDTDGNGGRGAVGNLEIGDTVTFINAQANVQADAVVSAINNTAADAQSWEGYRQVILDRFRKQPQGGALADYELWGEGVEGIINTYPYTGDPSEVNVYSEATEASSGSADLIPTAAQLLAVKQAIELDDSGLASRRPATAFVNSLAISRTSFDVTISNLATDEPSNLDPCKADIETSLISYFLSREPYVSGLSVGSRLDRITRSGIGGVIQDTVSAYSGTFDGVTVKLTLGAEFVIYSLGEGEKAKLGNVIHI